MHTHPSDITFSAEDVRMIVTDTVNTPDQCMYFVVGPQQIYLLYPTKQTQKSSLNQAWHQINSAVEAHTTNPNNRETSQSDLIVKLADEFKLGYYVGEKDDNGILIKQELKIL